jgi:predicted dehydrogenase/nucleoside-diphosphate-sugar epimerase
MMSITRQFRAGLVGAGHISEFHIRALQRLRNVTIVGLTDLDLARAAALARRFRLSEPLPSLEALLGRGVDVVHVLTPPSSHAAITLRALEAGCHVFVEKPMATSVEDCDRVIDAARRAGKNVGVDHTMLRDPFVERALELVRRGAIGDILAVDYVRGLSYPPYSGGPLPVHYRDGGYPFRDIGIHALSLMDAFLGDIEEVIPLFTSRDSYPNLHFSEWRAVVRCKNGTGGIHLSWNMRPAPNILTVHGTRGSLRADLFGMALAVKPVRRLPEFVTRLCNAWAEGCKTIFQVPWNVLRVVTGRIRRYHGLQKLVAEFYADLAAGRRFAIGPEQARPIVDWTERVARQADAAKQQHLDRFPTSLTAPVLVTGATGFIGKRLVGRLLEGNRRLRLFVRRPPAADVLNDPRIEVVLGDLGDPDAVERAVAGVEVVYHLGAAIRGSAADFQRGTVAGTQNIIASVLKYRVGKLVYVSSLSVLHATAMKPGTTVREDWPLEPCPGQRGFYTQTKLEAEQLVHDAVKQHGLPAVILRPGQVFGPGANLINAAVAIRRKNRFLIIGNGQLVLPLIYVEDLVDAILACEQRPVFDASIFHLVDPEQVSQNELVREYLNRTGRRMSVWHLPRWLLYGAALGVQALFGVLRRPAPISVYRLRSARMQSVFDCQAAQERLGWRPRIGVRGGLATTIHTISCETCPPACGTKKASPGSDSSR